MQSLAFYNPNLKNMLKSGNFARCFFRCCARKGNMDNKFSIIGNNRNICLQISAAMLNNDKCCSVHIAEKNGLDGLISEQFDILSNGRIILVFRNEELKDVTEVFYRRGFFVLSIFPWDTHRFDDNKAAESVIMIDNKNPRLDYVEIEVSRGCNLNCKGCNEFSNLLDKSSFGDLESTKRDLLRLKDLFWGIGKIRLMGGEPLMNPDFPEFVKATREIFPDCDLRLLSNGILIPKLSREDLQMVKECNCSFDISVYPPVKKMLKRIKKRLDENGVPYTLSLKNSYFFKSLLKEPLRSPVESFNNCLFTHCHGINDGYLSACTNQMYAYRLNEAFGLNFPTEDKIDLSSTELDGWAINRVFSQPHEFCRYCGQGMVPYRWETCPAHKAKAEDWLIEPTFLNVKVAPLVQKMLKNPAKWLRSKIRKPRTERR